MSYLHSLANHICYNVSSSLVLTDLHLIFPRYPPSKKDFVFFVSNPPPPSPRVLNTTRYKLCSWYMQGPKLTFLGKFFFQSPYGKMWSPKSRKKSVNKIFPSQRNTNQNFWLPDGKFWSPIFFFKKQNEENAFAFGAPMAIYTPTTEKPRRMNRMPAIYAAS